MQKRFVSIWFRHLKTDWMIRHHPHLKEVPFVLAFPNKGRPYITELSAKAKEAGIEANTVVADARVILPGIEVLDDKEDLSQRLLVMLCRWCIRFTPVAAVDLPDGIILDATGCTHLWEGEENYLRTLSGKLKSLGYHIRFGMADTIGTAWAIARFGRIKSIISSGGQAEAIRPLPPAALRLEASIVERLHKLGLHRIGSFINMPRSHLRRRFGEAFLQQLDYALGAREEFIQSVQPLVDFHERLPCAEPIATRKGIEIALKELLTMLCLRLANDGKGIRVASFKGYRVDNKIEEIEISTNYPSNQAAHLYKVFDLKVSNIEPALGIELFTLEAGKVEDVTPQQETFWTVGSSLQSKEVSQLLDGLQSKFGGDVVHRYMPAEHHLPERSVQPAQSLRDEPSITWCVDKWRPMQLLQNPEPIQVSAPVPDYPPMNFRYKGKLHIVAKADACERIEPEWWLDGGLHRDYYIVEDEEGKRYWVFRLGHYETQAVPLWFIHGFFE